MKRPALSSVVAIAVGLLAFPCLLIVNLEADGLVGPDLDLVIALHKAWIDDLRFGQDIIFTFGPLGFLMFPVVISRLLWGLAVLYKLALHCAFVFSLYAFVKRINTSHWRAILLGIASVLFLRALTPFMGNAVLLVSMVMVAFLLVQREDEGSPLLSEVLMGVASSLLVYAKFSDGVTSVLIVTVLAVLLGMRGRFRESAALMMSLGIGVMVMGLLLLGSVNGIMFFFRTYLHLAASYADAVALQGPPWQIDVAIAAGIVFVGLLLHDVLRRDVGVAFLLLSAPLLLTSLKHGLVRHDTPHVIPFFAVWTIVFVLYVCVRGAWRVRAVGGVSAVAAVVLLMSLILAVSDRRGGFGFLSADRNGLVQASEMLDIVVRGKRRDHALLNHPQLPDLDPSVRSRIGSSGVDIFPWEVGVVARAGLNWKPRPVFQSYSVFSGRLEDLNEAYFRRPDAPEYLLFGNISIDARYPLFDEPKTFKHLLRSYRPVGRTGNLLVLEKSDVNDSAAETRGGERQVVMGVPVSVPRAERGYVFAVIEAERSFWGKMAGILYKPPQLYITFALSSGSTVKHVLVPSVARRGLFISQYTYDLNDVDDVWRGRLRENVSSITISSPDKRLWKENVRVRFSELPFQFVIRPPRKWPDVDTLAKVRKPLYHIDAINGVVKPAKHQPVRIDLKRNPVVRVSGWAADRMAREAAREVFITVDGQMVARAGYGIQRGSVARQFKNEDFRYTGWKAFIDGDVLEEGKHNLSLIVVSADGKRYYEPEESITILLKR